MSLRVVRVAASVSPTDGGPSLGTLALSRELRDLGVDDVIVSTDAHGNGHLRIEQLGNVEKLDVTLTRVHSPRALKASLGLVPALARRIRKADVVHIHGFYLFHTMAAAALARLFGVPYLIQPHGVFEPYQEEQSTRRKSLYNRVAGTFILRNTAGLLFATEAEREHAEMLLTRYGLSSWLMPLGSTAPGAAEPDGVPRPRSGESHNILFLARIAPKKRVDLVIGAFPLVLSVYPDARLTIAGSGDASLLTEPLAALPAHARARVDLAGFVEGEAKLRAFARADVYVLPSENENFGISVAEALNHGLPVVVSAEVAIAPRIAEWAAGVVLPERSIAAVAEGLITALAQGNREAMSENAARLARTHFSWKSSAQQAIKVYADVMQSSSHVNTR